jgi:hypothetical protein
MEKPVIILESRWEIEGEKKTKIPQEAMEFAFRLI